MKMPNGDRNPRAYAVIDIESYVRTDEAHRRYQDAERYQPGQRSRRGYEPDKDPVRNPRWPFQEIVCASVMILTEHQQGNLQVMRFETFSRPQHDEAQIVANLFKVIADAPRGTEIASWQGANHDLPLILRAALSAGLTLPANVAWLCWGGEGRVGHIDLARYLSGGLKMKQVHMAEYAAALDVPAKIASLPASVARLGREGKWDLVRATCEGDVITTALILARWRQLTDGRASIEVAIDRLLRQVLDLRPDSVYSRHLVAHREHRFRHSAAQALFKMGVVAPYLDGGSG